jgi:hypothetical protein
MYKLMCIILSAVVIAFCRAIRVVCLHDVSLMYTCLESAHGEREERQDNARGTRNVLTPRTVTSFVSFVEGSSNPSLHKWNENALRHHDRGEKASELGAAFCCS